MKIHEILKKVGITTSKSFKKGTTPKTEVLKKKEQFRGEY